MTARLVGRQLTVAYGARRALDGIDVSLAAGELVALVGPNGVGKSTLLRVLLGAQRADAGTVELDGIALDRIARRVRARTLTMVAHGTAPDFALRVRDLVAMGRIPHEPRFGGPSAADARAVEEAMVATDVASLADRTVDTLSAGERERAHLARVFAQGASVVLLDEPTANLDPLHQLAAMALLRSFTARGGAALVAMHDLGLAARTADRVVVLSCGRVHAAGPPAETITEALLAEVFGVKARVARGESGAIEHVTPLAPIDAPPAGKSNVESPAARPGSRPAAPRTP